MCQMMNNKISQALDPQNDTHTLQLNKEQISIALIFYEQGLAPDFKKKMTP